MPKASEKRTRHEAKEAGPNKYAFQDEWDEAEALEYKIQTWDDAINEVVTDEMRKENPTIERELKNLTNELEQVAGKDLQELDKLYNTAKFHRPIIRNPEESAWNDEEYDEDKLTDEKDDEDFVGNDITSMAHGKLEEIRERRHYARVTVWEMPLLASPFPLSAVSREEC